MHNLIVKKCTAACALADFNYVHYFEHYILSIFITPKHLKLIAGGMPSGAFVNNPLEGYRTLVPNKITQTLPTKKTLKVGRGERIDRPLRLALN